MYSSEKISHTVSAGCVVLGQALQHTLLKSVLDAPFSTTRQPSTDVQSKPTRYTQTSQQVPGYEFIPRKDKPNQAAGWITRCYECGDLIIVRHRKKTLCVFCQAINCGLDLKKFSRFYRSAQWRRLRKAVFELKGNVCVYCPKKATHVDHKIPFKSGGTNLPENLQPVCGSCNSKKHGKSEKEFLELNPQLSKKEVDYTTAFKDKELNSSKHDRKENTFVNKNYKPLQRIEL